MVLKLFVQSVPRKLEALIEGTEISGRKGKIILIRSEAPELSFSMIHYPHQELLSSGEYPFIPIFRERLLR